LKFKIYDDCGVPIWKVKKKGKKEALEELEEFLKFK